MRGLFAGFDVSTQSCKLVVIDLERPADVYTDSIRYDDDLPHYGTDEGAVRGLGEGVSESDPHMWIEAVECLLTRLHASDVAPEHIRCISVSGQQHGLVALDRDGSLTRPHAKLWNDFSTAQECLLLTERVGGEARMLEQVGNIQRPGYTAPKILHLLRHEPERYHRATTLFVVHNYVNWHLTGGPDGGIAVMEPGDTSGMALWNPATQDWSQEVLDAIDSGLRAKLPAVRPADATIGRIGARLAEEHGLSPDCTVDAGCGDNMYGAVGTGNVVPGIVTISLGTSGTACTVVDEPFVDPTGEIAGYCDSTGRYLPLLCVSNMSNGYSVALETFGLSHAEFDDAITCTRPGNDGRLLIPWYEGERSPNLPSAAPLYFGFGVDDFSPERVCRAVLEGHVLNLHRGASRLPIDPEVIRLTGGLSISPAWCQMIADVFEADVVPVGGEGAALHAAWVWHRESGADLALVDLAEPFVMLEQARRRQPIGTNAAVYRVQKSLFAALSDRARGLEADDPFVLRARLVAAIPDTPAG